MTLDGVERLGYTTRQALFLSIAARNSAGYFVRAQIDEFAGVKAGGVSARLIAHALYREDVRCLEAGKLSVYQLRSRDFWRAVCIDRSMRLHRPSTIRKFLLGLDYMIHHACGQCPWFVGEG